MDNLKKFIIFVYLHLFKIRRKNVIFRSDSECFPKDLTESGFN